MVEGTINSPRNRISPEFRAESHTLLHTDPTSQEVPIEEVNEDACFNAHASKLADSVRLRAMHQISQRHPLPAVSP